MVEERSEDLPTPRARHGLVDSAAAAAHEMR